MLFVGNVYGFRLADSYESKTIYHGSDTYYFDIRHLEEDAYVPGNIVFIYGNSLQTVKVGNLTNIAGSKETSGYREGVGTDAKFDYPMIFTQINQTMMVVADAHNYCLRLIDRISRQTSQLVGTCGEWDRGVTGLIRYVVKSSRNHFEVIFATDDKIGLLNLMDLTITEFWYAYPTQIYSLTQEEHTGNIFFSLNDGLSAKLVVFDFESHCITVIGDSDSTSCIDVPINGSSINGVAGCHLRSMIFIGPNKLLVSDNQRNFIIDVKMRTTVQFKLIQRNFDESTVLIGNTIYTGNWNEIYAYEGIFTCPTDPTTTTVPTTTVQTSTTVQSTTPCKAMEASSTPDPALTINIDYGFGDPICPSQAPDRLDSYYYYYYYPDFPRPDSDSSSVLDSNEDQEEREEHDDQENSHVDMNYLSDEMTVAVIAGSFSAFALLVLSVAVCIVVRLRSKVQPIAQSSDDVARTYPKKRSPNKHINQSATPQQHINQSAPRATEFSYDEAVDLQV